MRTSAGVVSAEDRPAPTKCWSLVSSTGVCPTARSGHSAVVAKESLYIFGGCGHPAVKHSACEGAEVGPELAETMPICLGDLHVYDLARQRWSEVAYQAGSAEARPAERTCAAMCASEEEDRLFLSGGAGDDPYDLRADLLEFDVRRRSWRLLYDGGGSGASAGSAAPCELSACRRIGHAMVHDTARNRLVVFGGSTGLEYFDDTHAFDLSAGTWVALPTTGDRPSPRYKHQAFVDSNFMYVVGGGSFEPEGPDLDVYRLHLAGPKALEWERVRPTGTPPRCRAAHGLSWDRMGRAAYIWGGFTSGMELDSTFCALRLPPAALDTELLPSQTAATGPVSGSVASAAAPAPAAVTSAAETDPTAAVDDFRGLAGGFAEEVVSNGRNPTGGVAEAASARDKPTGEESIGPPASSELAEQQQWQQQRQQQQQTTPSEAQGNTGVREGYARESRRPRGQRLWRQGSGGRRNEDRSSSSSSSSNNNNSSRRPRENGRRRPWGQGWARGRLQGLWGGGGGGGGAHPPPSFPAPAPPAPPESAAMAAVSAIDPRRAGEASASASTLGASPAPLPPLGGHVRVVQPGQRDSPPAKTLVGEELFWVLFPSRSSQGSSGAATAPPSPAGRSFHCAFFHGGACYVTGGSDGARKFGDMWRFTARESPPPLTTLAARAFVAEEARKKGGSGGGAGGGGGGDDGGSWVPHMKLLEGLPGELRDALVNLNTQAKVVV